MNNPKTLQGWIMFYLLDSLLGSVCFVAIVTVVGSLVMALGMSVAFGECPFGGGFSKVFPVVYSWPGVLVQIIAAVSLSLIVGMVVYLRRTP